MNRIERLTATLLLLQEKPRTSSEIARHFELSKRTVLRDVQALCEMGVPVVSQDGAGGGYSLPSSYRLAPLPLTSNEAFLLLLALNAINRLADTPFLAERASLSAKLRALLPDDQRPEVERMLETVAVDVPERTQRSAFLETLMSAAREERWVLVTYKSAARISSLHILPRQINMQSGYWYCRAYTFEREEERTYRVDRVQSVSQTEDGFQHVRASEPRPYGHESHPEVHVTLTAQGAAHVESEPHLGQHIQRHTDGTGHLNFRCPPSELGYYARYFAGLGGEAQVHSPPELRELLAQVGRSLTEQYR
ncbi:MAG TPA: WYL domain-containing protein [Chloroflexia bacterium]|jgi:predicted DNA-binding transcriptional regulator YafY